MADAIESAEKANNSELPEWREWVIAITSQTSMAIGIVVLSGWLANIAILKSVIPGLATMKFNTAVCLVLAGLGLRSLSAPVASAWRQALGMVAAGGVTLISLATLAEYVFALNLGIDQLFVADDGPVNPFCIPGRMAPATGLSLFFAGAAILLTHVGWVPRLVQVFGLLAALLGWLAVLGYWFDLEGLYRLLPFSSMALHTSVALCGLGTGIMVLRPDIGFMRLFTSDAFGWAALGLSFLLAWLRLAGQALGLYDTGLGTALAVAGCATVSVIAVCWAASRWAKRESVSSREAEVPDESIRELAELLRRISPDGYVQPTIPRREPPAQVPGKPAQILPFQPRERSMPRAEAARKW